MSCDVVVLSKFPEIFKGFQDCVDIDAPELTKLCVWDNGAPPSRTQKWSHFVAVGEFNMARNGNLGLRASDRDVLYCGDDVRFIEPDTIARIEKLSHSDPSIGILSPSVRGLCTMHPAPLDQPLSFVQWVGFVCVFIKRDVIDRVGLLDERFTGYSWDDLDYCLRVRQAGYEIAIARDVTIQHGVNGNVYASTFIQTRGEAQMAKDEIENRNRFAAKYGLENADARVWEFMERLC